MLLVAQMRLSVFFVMTLSEIMFSDQELNLILPDFQFRFPGGGTDACDRQKS